MKKRTISALSIVAGAIIAGGMIGREERDKRKTAERSSGRTAAMLYLMNHWVKIKQEGKNLASVFVQNGYQRIAVYGLSDIGEALVRELKGTNVEVVYGIDQRARSICAEVPVVTPDGPLEDVDVIVVTAIQSFDEIRENLQKKKECPIVSIEDIVFAVS